MRRVANFQALYFPSLYIALNFLPLVRPCPDTPPLSWGPLQSQPFVPSSADNFSDTVATATNANTSNQPAVYIDQVDSKADGIQNTINDGVFSQVNSNTTLNNVSEDIRDLVEAIVGGTPI